MARFRPLAWMTPEERAKALHDEQRTEFDDRQLRKSRSKGAREENRLRKLNDPIGSVNIRHSMLAKLHTIRDIMSRDGPRISIRETLENIITFWEKGNR